MSPDYIVSYFRLNPWRQQPPVNIQRSEINFSQEHIMQDPLDALLVVRGCANDERRLDETVKQMKNISEWRSKVRMIIFDDRDRTAKKQN